MRILQKSKTENCPSRFALYWPHILAVINKIVRTIVRIDWLILEKGGPISVKKNKKIIPKKFVWIFAAVLTMAFLFTNSSGNQEPILAIANAHIYPVTQTDIPSGTLLVKGTKILAVGENLTIPDIVIWKNHPLSTWGESQTVIINGTIVFQR